MSAFHVVFTSLLATAIAELNVDQHVSGRLWGGQAVPMASVTPYMASLRSISNVHFCGGTIVSNRYVLTAAQCTIGRAANGINIAFGTTQRRSVGTLYRSQSIIPHPGFDRTTLANDICLVMTALVIPITPNIVQAASINPSLSVESISVTMSGWGSTLKEANPNLHSITTNTISNTECESRQSEENVWRVTDAKICTSTGVNGMCYGDEGGAIISNDSVIAVASFHSHCSNNTADIYERVAPHRMWIQSYIR